MKDETLTPEYFRSEIAKLWNRMSNPHFWDNMEKATMAMRSLTFLHSRMPSTLNENDTAHLQAIWNEFNFRLDHIIRRKENKS